MKENDKKSNIVKCDENGIPQYSAKDIENKAEEFIKFFDKTVLNAPTATPFEMIAEKLEQDYNIKISFEAYLGKADDGTSEILGKFVFNPMSIYVSVSLKKEQNRFNFTFAHEIGHLVLHRNLTIKGYSNGISDTKHDFVTGKKILVSPYDWIEWQANKFASCLLLPRETTLKAVVEKQLEIGINKRIGFIYLDKQSCNLRDFLLILDHLQSIFQASKSTIEYRLNNLGILIDKRGQDTKHISELLRSE